MHVYKLSLCTYNQILGLVQLSVSSCSHVCIDWERNKKRFVSCSDFVRNGNSLSNMISFLLSYTELITLTALELAIEFLEGFYLLFYFLCRLSCLFATDVFLEKFQKGFLVPLGRPRRLFTRSNLISSRPIWLEFKLIQYFIPVLLTCKFDDAPLKNTGAIVSTTFIWAPKGE